MIKTVQTLSEYATIQNGEVKKFLMQLESDLLRGLNTLLVLHIIHQSGDMGSYAYKINKQIQELTHNIIIFEESTLYVLLKGLEKENLVISSILPTDLRKTKRYMVTSLGMLVYNYGIGFLTSALKILCDSTPSTRNIQIETIFPQIPSKSFLCPNCSNQIPIGSAPIVRFCLVCGCYIEEYVNRLAQSTN